VTGFGLIEAETLPIVTLADNRNGRFGIVLIVAPSEIVKELLKQAGHNPSVKLTLISSVDEIERLCIGSNKGTKTPGEKKSKFSVVPETSVRVPKTCRFPVLPESGSMEKSSIGIACAGSASNKLIKNPSMKILHLFEYIMSGLPYVCL